MKTHTRGQTAETTGLMRGEEEEKKRYCTFVFS